MSNKNAEKEDNINNATFDERNYILLLKGEISRRCIDDKIPNKVEDPPSTKKQDVSTVSTCPTCGKKHDRDTPIQHRYMSGKIKQYDIYKVNQKIYQIQSQLTEYHILLDDYTQSKKTVKKLDDIIKNFENNKEEELRKIKLPLMKENQVLAEEVVRLKLELAHVRSEVDEQNLHLQQAENKYNKLKEFMSEVTDVDKKSCLSPSSPDKFRSVGNTKKSSTNRNSLSVGTQVLPLKKVDIRKRPGSMDDCKSYRFGDLNKDKKNPQSRIGSFHRNSLSLIQSFVKNEDNDEQEGKYQQKDDQQEPRQAPLRNILHRRLRRNLFSVPSCNGNARASHENGDQVLQNSKSVHLFCQISERRSSLESMQQSFTSQTSINHIQLDELQSITFDENSVDDESICVTQTMPKAKSFPINRKSSKGEIDVPLRSIQLQEYGRYHSCPHVTPGSQFANGMHDETNTMCNNTDQTSRATRLTGQLRNILSILNNRQDGSTEHKNSTTNCDHPEKHFLSFIKPEATPDSERCKLETCI